MTEAFFDDSPEAIEAARVAYEAASRAEIESSFVRIMFAAWADGFSWAALQRLPKCTWMEFCVRHRVSYRDWYFATGEISRARLRSIDGH